MSLPRQKGFLAAVPVCALLAWVTLVHLSPRDVLGPPVARELIERVVRLELENAWLREPTRAALLRRATEFPAEFPLIRSLTVTDPGPGNSGAPFSFLLHLQLDPRGWMIHDEADQDLGSRADLGQLRDDVLVLVWPAAAQLSLAARSSTRRYAAAAAVSLGVALGLWWLALRFR